MKHNPKIPAGGGDYTSLADSSSQHLTDTTHTNTSPKTHQINNNDTDSSQSHNNLESFHLFNTSHSSLVLKSLFHKYSFSSLWHSFHLLFTSPKDIKTYTRYKDISLFAILNICFLICVYTPFAIYSSDMSQFDAKDSLKTLCILCGFFILSASLFIYITSFLYTTRFIKIVSLTFAFLCVMGVLNTFIFTGDYGAMDHFILQNPTFFDVNLRTQKIFYALLCFTLSVVFVALAFKYLKTIFQILFVTLFLSSGVYSYEILSTQRETLIQREEAQKSTQAPYEKELFTYAKDKPNIVVFVLDMFSGSHMKPILEQFPHIKEYLDGFILFDNAISTTNSTIHSVATLIGGEHYSVYNMNARGDNLKKSITQAFGSIGDNFIKNGYDVGYFMGVASESSEAVRAYNQNIFNVQNIGVFFQYYFQTKEGLLEDYLASGYKDNKNIDVLRLLSVGIFRASPEWFFRPRIYNYGAWIFSSNDMFSITPLFYASSFYAFTHIHSLGSDKPTFKFLHSLMTHLPFLTYYDNGKCSHFKQQTAWEEYPHKSQMNYKEARDTSDYYQHYDTEACALEFLNDYLGWLKSEGIYDNTQIFIVSDHSGFDSIDIPKMIISNGARPDTLLLFKDFNARGALRIDSNLMVNYDIVSVFCANLPQGCPNVPQNILQNYPINRRVISTIPTSWEISKHKANEWILNHIYRINGNIYESTSWQEITDDIKGDFSKIAGEH